MKTILDEIVAHKRAQLKNLKAEVSIEEIQQKELFTRTCISATERLKKGTGIIAEFKRKSPSKGWINKEAKVTEIVKSYERAGASLISVLSDQVYFGAQEEDFSLARRAVEIPILRKDFIIDEYQIYESKAMGADVILLIAAILTTEQVSVYSALAKQLGMEVLLEIHDESELNHLCNTIDLVGINNRNLKDFSVNTERSIKMVQALPKQMIRVAESGLHSAEQVVRMRQNGFQAFLMGEYFMKSENPGSACQELIDQISQNTIR